MYRFAEFSHRVESYLTREIATRGALEAWSSLFAALPNPDPVLRKTGQSITILDEIRRENHVDSCSESREAAVTKKKWAVERVNSTETASQVIDNVFKSLPLRKITGEICEAWGYGFQISEIVWARQGDLLLPERIVGKSRKLFMFGMEGELIMRRSPGDPTGVPVPEYKFLLTQHRASYDNPYGVSKYSSCFWPVTFKKGGIKFWAVFLEKFGTPKLVGKLPRALMDTEERNILLQTLVDMVQDACGVIPDDGSVEAMEANVTASSDVYERFAAYQNSEISTAILGHSAGATATPGRLGGEDLAAQVRADLVENDANMVTDTINTLIRYIHALNPSLGTERPNFLLYDERDIDEKRAARDAQLLNTGKISLTKKYFVDKYGFGEDEIEVIEPINADNAQNYQTGLVTPEFSAATPSSGNLTSPNQSQDAVDIMASEGLPDEKLQTQAENLLKPVLELVETVDSFDDITKGLNKLYNNIDADSVQTMLEKGTLLSETWGRANA